MATAISNSADVTFIPPTPVVPQQVKSGSKDSDGNTDGSKAAEVEKPKATSGNIGTVVNTEA